MPFLRMPEDSSLAETLGNLGQSLGNALNPMNQIRAQDMLAQARQRQWEIQQQQRIDAANQNAATVYRNANPFNEDPASLEVSANNIASGHADLSKSIDGVKALGGWKANQKAADMYAAAHPELLPDQLSSDQAELIAGRKSASELSNDRANAALTANKAVNTITGTTAARGATTGPNSALAAEAAANADPATAGKLIAQGNQLNAPIITGSLNDPNVQAQIDKQRTEQAIAGTTPPAGQPVSSGLAAPAAVADITQKNIVAQSAPRAPGNIVPSVAAIDPITGQPVPVAPGAAPPSGAFSQPRQGPDTAATAETAAADEGTKYRIGEVQKDIASGSKAYQLLRTTALLREYAGELDNNTPWDQGKSAFMNRVFDGTGITFTPGQSAREAFTQISKQLMGAARTDDGIQRVAGPEIQVLNAQMPNAQQDRPSLMRSLDQLEMKARRLIEEGRVAGDLYGSTGGNIDAKQFSDYTTKRNQIETPPTMDKPVGTPDTTPVTGTPPRPKGVRIFRPDGTLVQ